MFPGYLGPNSVVFIDSIDKHKFVLHDIRTGRQVCFESESKRQTGFVCTRVNRVDMGLVCISVKMVGIDLHISVCSREITSTII